MLADAVIEELGEIRSESLRWQEDRNAWLVAMSDMKESVHEKFQEIDGLRLEIRSFKCETPHPHCNIVAWDSGPFGCACTSPTCDYLDTD